MSLGFDFWFYCLLMLCIMVSSFGHCDIVKMEVHFFSLDIYFSTGCLKEWWCAVGRLRWKRVFGWTGMYEIGVATKPYFLSYKCREIIHGCDALYLSKYTVNSALQCFFLSFNRSKPLRKSPSMLLSSEELAKDMVRISNSASCILFSLSLYNNLVYFFSHAFPLC